MVSEVNKILKRPSATPGWMGKQKYQLGNLPICQEQERLLSCLDGHSFYSTGVFPGEVHI